MRIKHTVLFELDELKDDAKQKAIETCSDINVNYAWWEFIYGDAERIGLKITSFDFDGNITGELTKDLEDVIQDILSEHGDSCDTYKLASEYAAKISPETDDEEGCNAHDDAVEKLAGDFKYALLEEYLSILRKEYDYMTSEESIVETIKANVYEFTESGKLA